MIIGLTGPICAGKTALAQYLKDKYDFKVINLLLLFREVTDDDVKLTLDSPKKRSEEDDDTNDNETLSQTNSFASINELESIVEAMQIPFDQDSFTVFRTITSDWKSHYVIYPLSSCEEIQIMIYYFILYECDAPVKQRYLRFKQKYNQQSSMSLENFVDLDDNINFNKEEYSMYKTDEEHQHFIRRRFHNSGDILDFYRTLDEFKFDNKDLVRPSWDTYFMKFAELAAQRSNCMKRGNGAIIVKDFRIVSTGYNGTPFKHINCNEGGCQRCNSNVAQGLELDKCKCLHAEESACIEAGRPRTLDAIIYTTSFPCLLCTKIIIQAGIRKIVYNKNYDSVLSKEMLAESGIELVQHVV
ncbi:deoxycytidylate deaminase [Stylonychia lemnae]|uniref:dCMP deaminase n=1 Tax=Stylonychia lemnae TaxID=5949 RepID=A0A077ZSD6_STYLE|nr:deoxycytidylate deaminase [Stylonychia lemnae]|eukprot:CDW72449.1 deoxycytidylate deaminase [Stylonychia lemnae]